MPDSAHFTHLLAFRIPKGTAPAIRKVDERCWEVEDGAVVIHVRCAECGVELLAGTDYSDCGGTEPWGDIPWQSPTVVDAPWSRRAPDGL